MAELGHLERVDLRDLWKTEAGDFTPWLSEEKNISILGEAVGLDLEVQSTEKQVGPFRADILCKETASDHIVLIENQLERTDHTHLGQLMTYASGLNAVSVIWIAERFTDEHRAALDWLNEITDQSINFFGLEIELWRIGDSDIAPKFNVVSKPNEWVRIMSEKKTRSGPLSETQENVLAYWCAFKGYLEERDTFLRIGTPSTDSWRTFPVGRSGFSLFAVVNTKSRKVFCYLAMSGDDAKPHFHLLEEQKTSIEAEFGEALDWRPMLEKKESHVHVEALNSDPIDKSQWEKQHDWFCEKLELLHQVFFDRVKTLNADDYDRIGDD